MRRRFMRMQSVEELLAGEEVWEGEEEPLPGGWRESCDGEASTLKLKASGQECPLHTGFSFSPLEFHSSLSAKDLWLEVSASKTRFEKIPTIISSEFLLTPDYGFGWVWIFGIVGRSVEVSAPCTRSWFPGAERSARRPGCTRDRQEIAS